MTRFIAQNILAPVLVTSGVIGNIFNIVVLKSPKMKSSTNVYLMALAICDSMYLIFMFLLSFFNCENKNQLKFIFYTVPFGRVFSDLFGNTAVWLTVAFTLERYIGVCHPMKGKAWCTIGKAKLAVIFVFIISLVNTFPEFFELEIVEYGDIGNEKSTVLKCQTTRFGSTSSYQIGYFWWYVAFFNFLPLILLAVFNSILILSVWKANKTRRTLSNSTVIGETTRQATEQQKVTTMLISVVIIFLLCQLPWAILLLYKAYISANDIHSHGDSLRIAGNVCNLLVEFNSSVNFLLYSYFSSRFRRTFQSIFCKWRRERDRRRSLSSSSDTFRKSSSSKDSTTVTSVSSYRSKRMLSDVSVRENLISQKL
ncbi:FMRFamide receptor-like [Ylistrum balloti]|uniref:FMRFamide receptor-like n=1 Tax=Ylistrum balloti TaxID=509963 RepID=UPI002905A398|nr:FMRFamide receptor-like [Ylistrum balloti]